MLLLRRAGVPGRGQSSSVVHVGRDYCATMTKHQTRRPRLPLVAMPLREQFLDFNVSPANAAKSSAAANSHLCQLLAIPLDRLCSREGQWRPKGDFLGHSAHWRTTSRKLLGSTTAMGETTERRLSGYDVAIFNRGSARHYDQSKSERIGHIEERDVS
jgi:hypothetical protein